VPIAILVAAACTDDPVPTPGPTRSPPPEATTVALVLAPGDPALGVNVTAIEGLERSIDAGLVARGDTETFEPDLRGTDRRAVLRRAADGGADLVIAIGTAYSRAVDAVRTGRRTQRFAIVNGDAEAAPSVANLGFANNEGSFLAGAAAAMKSKTGTVGFVGGEAGTGLIERSQAGFEAGAREVDPEVRLLVTYLGEDPSAFDDPVAARSAAATMYASGADVIAHDAGASGVGVFEAAADVQALAIGADVDETLLVPLELQEVILTSVVDRVDVAVEDAIRAVTADTFVGGFHAYGIAEGGVDLAVNEINATPRLLSDAMRLRLDELAARVVAGEIVVPVVPEVEPELPTAPAVPSVSPTAPSTTDPSGTGSP
jgi:basic membrane protein A